MPDKFKSWKERVTFECKEKEMKKLHLETLLVDQRDEGEVL